MKKLVIVIFAAALSNGVVTAQTKQGVKTEQKIERKSEKQTVKSDVKRIEKTPTKKAMPKASEKAINPSEAKPAPMRKEQR